MSLLFDGRSERWQSKGEQVYSRGFTHAKTEGKRRKSFQIKTAVPDPCAFDKPESNRPWFWDTNQAVWSQHTPLLLFINEEKHRCKGDIISVSRKCWILGSRMRQAINYHAKGDHYSIITKINWRLAQGLANVMYSSRSEEEVQSNMQYLCPM